VLRSPIHDDGDWDGPFPSPVVLPNLEASDEVPASVDVGPYPFAVEVGVVLALRCRFNGGARNEHSRPARAQCSHASPRTAM
jgi:hypothetical protein